MLRGDEKSDQFPVSIYLSVHMPCTVSKVYPQKEHKPQEVRSVFRYPGSPLVNAWNLHQTFFLAGQTTNEALARLFEVVAARNPLCKVSIKSLSEAGHLCDHVVKSIESDAKSKYIYILK